MRASKRPWLFAILGALVIEAFLSEMEYRAVVIPGGRTFWGTLGGLAHLPGEAVGEAVFPKSPMIDVCAHASGLRLWFLVFWAAICVATALFHRPSAEQSGAAPNG